MLALRGICILECWPKHGDEDYIKRPENTFILFRRDCCQKRNADALANGAEDPNVRRQRQSDLSKTISQQWCSLNAEKRKHWDKLAKQRKKEHEDMYPWYVYQSSRLKEKKGKGKGGEDDSEEGPVVEGKRGNSKREGKDKDTRAFEVEVVLVCNVKDVVPLICLDSLEQIAFRGLEVYFDSA